MLDVTSIQKLMHDLDAADKNSTDAFHAIINRSLTVLELSDRNLSRMFGMSVPSARRWMSGRGAPHPIIRPAIYKALKAVCLEKLYGPAETE